VWGQKPYLGHISLGRTGSTTKSSTSENTGTLVAGCRNLVRHGLQRRRVGGGEKKNFLPNPKKKLTKHEARQEIEKGLRGVTKKGSGRPTETKTALSGGNAVNSKGTIEGVTIVPGTMLQFASKKQIPGGDDNFPRWAREGGSRRPQATNIWQESGSGKRGRNRKRF